MVLGRQFDDRLDQVGQQTLFRTDKHGPANVYRAHPEGMNIPDRDETRHTYHRERGEFYDFDYPSGSREATWANNLHPHYMAVGDISDRDGQETIGHDAYPSAKKAIPDDYSELRWGKPERSGGFYSNPSEKTITVETREGSPVGKVTYSPTMINDGNDDPMQATRVDTAEISPLFRGRKFSAKAIPDFLENHAEYGPIVVDGYTDAGAAAFGRKGIQNEDYIREGAEYEAEQRKRFRKKPSGRPLGRQFQQPSLF